jgi:DNA invertase Pin-like site-specific DNA recombinase
MKAIILARVSTKEQQEEGHSIPSQVGRLTEYAKSKNLHIHQIFKIVESSSQDTRREFEQILKAIEESKEPIVLVTDTIDRLQRSFRESVILEKYRKSGKLELHFFRENLILNQNSNSSGLIRWDMGVMFARSYVLQLSDNVKRSIEQKLRNGEWIGKAPIGYINTTDHEGNKTIIPDPERARYITKIFEMYATGNHSMKIITREMKKLGLNNNTPLKKSVSLSQIKWILKNPFYCGQMRVKEKLYQHHYEPIISLYLFNKAQEVAKSWNKKPFRYASKPAIFRGIIKCAECGCTITPEVKKGRYTYYSCSNYHDVHKKRIYIKEEDLLKPIYEALKSIKIPDDVLKWLTQELKKIHENKNRFHQENLKKLQKDYDLLEERISKMYDDKLDGFIPEDLYQKKLKEYKEKQRDILIQIEEHNKADENFYITASKVLDLANRALEIFESSEVNEKRALINLLLQNPLLSERKLLFSLHSPFNMIAECGKTKNWPIGQLQNFFREYDHRKY